jgi:GT2 family glycosyltransferase
MYCSKLYCRTSNCALALIRKKFAEDLVEGRALVSTGPYSIAVSIVLFKTPIAEIEKLIADFLNQGVTKVFVIDNSPLSFNTFGNVPSSEFVEKVRVGENLGYGRAHNLAIGRSVDKFKYHIVCNPDISLASNLVATLTEYMDMHLEVGLCMPRLIGSDGLEQHCCRRSPLLWDYVSQLIFPMSWGLRRKHLLEMRDYDYAQIMEVECLSGCFMMFRSSVLRKLEGFDERYFMYFEDFDLSMRAKRIARNIFVPLSFVIHERRSEHRRSWRLRIAFATSALRYFSRWGMFWKRST